MAEDPNKGGIRPSVMSLTISQKSALYAAYIPHLRRGVGPLVELAPPLVGDGMGGLQEAKAR